MLNNIKTFVGKTKDGVKVDVIDLTPLYLSNKKLFNKLFSESQKIYNYSFPKWECETASRVKWWYFDKPIKDNSLERSFYLTSIINGDSKGMACLFLKVIDDFSVVFFDYIAIDKNYYNKGIGSLLLEAFFKNPYLRSIERKKPLKYLILEVKKPETNYRDKNRDLVRPVFYHKILGASAAVIIDKTNNVHLIPFCSPSIKKNRRIQPPVPFLFLLTEIDKGNLEKITIEPGTAINQSGKLICDKKKLKRLDKIKGLKIILTFIDSYKDGNSGYSDLQIENIKRRIIKSLDESEYIYFIPVHDTRYLQSCK